MSDDLAGAWGWAQAFSPGAPRSVTATLPIDAEAHDVRRQ
jgi:hypothetical protein